MEKATAHKRPLKEQIVRPEQLCEIKKDPKAFQKLRAVPLQEVTFPLKLMRGEKLLLDFGDHHVGYLHFTLSQDADTPRIADSPTKLYFTFGEFPLEIVTPAEEYRGSLGKGWLQQEERYYAFLPYTGSLERRYSFRYLLIERTDTADFPINISDLYAVCTSAVELSDAPAFSVKDAQLQKIYDMSLKTLKECEQDVFEDGPKRDRRLWIGDLRLQALTDYVTFRNLDLIKRCIYLFAGYRAEHKMVAPCIFPDSPPYIDGWTFADYSLFLISCLYDYLEHTGDAALVEELYDIALEQAQEVSKHFDKTTGALSLNPFIDWCPDLDKSAAIVGVYLYTLRQLLSLSETLKKDTVWIKNEIRDAETMLMRFWSKEDGLFHGATGQLSWHSQVWAVLSGTLTSEEAVRLLETAETAALPFTMHTPYMIHYYIEALYRSGLKQKALDVIRANWGRILDTGLDCCPEIFNPANEFESPYNAPEINSACHAWSCTPAYWIRLLCQE